MSFLSSLYVFYLMNLLKFKVMESFVKTLFIRIQSTKDKRTKKENTSCDLITKLIKKTGNNYSTGNMSFLNLRTNNNKLRGSSSY